MHRGKVARSAARRFMTAIDAVHEAARLQAFRQEIGATVRSVSPVLVAVLESAGMALDDVAWMIRPATAWPARPRLSESEIAKRWIDPWMWQTGLPMTPGMPVELRDDVEHGVGLVLPGFDAAAVRIVGHSIEVGTRAGGVVLATRHGELRVATGAVMPDAVLCAAVGRRLEEVVAHPALDGGGWRVARVDPFTPSTLVVATGSRAYRLPWRRPSA